MQDTISYDIIKDLDTYIEELREFLIKPPKLIDLSKFFDCSLLLKTFREHKKDLEIKKNNYKSWGKLGWSYHYKLCPCQESAPDTLEAADAKIMESFTKEEIDIFIEEIKDHYEDCPKAYDEALKCYSLGLYNSCSLVLFSLIDKFIISRQPISQNNNRRKLGNSGFERLSKSLDDSGITYPTDILFQKWNTTFSLSKIYEYGNDFKFPKMLIINRNYVTHGMANRDITFIDCVKLFLLFRNVCQMMVCIDMIDTTLGDTRHEC